MSKGVNPGTGGVLPLTSDADLIRSLRENAKMAQVTMGEIDFSNAPTVQPIGFRFIIPIPNLGNDNRTIEVKNWKGETETIVGYGFRNGADSALQAVDGDGSGVILLLVNPETCDKTAVSKAILTKIAELGGTESLDVAKLDTLVKFIQENVGITDMYNSKDSIAGSMQGQDGLSASSDRPLGLYEKKDKAGPKAVFVDGRSAVLDGPHAGAAVYDNGFMAVQIPGKKEGDKPTYRSIAPEAITACYRLADGTDLSDPRQQLPVVKVG
jgi:hypothetical protein